MIKLKFWYGWLLVFFCWLIYFINSGFPMYGGNIANAMMVEQTGMSRTVLGVGATLFNLFSGLLGVVVGNLITKRGSKVSLYIGTVMLIAGAVVLGFLCNGNPIMFILGYGIILGVGINFGTAMPLQTSLIYWHDRKRSLALGLCMTAAGLGSFVASPIMSKIATSSGWQACWIFVVIACAVNLIIIKVFMVNKPEDIGQKQDGYLKSASTADNSGKKASASRVYRTPVDWEYKDAIKTKTCWMILLGMCGYFCVYIVIMNQGVNLLIDHGIAADTAALYMSVLGIGSLVARIVFGWVGDRIEPRFVWIFTTLMTIAGAWLLKDCYSVGLMYVSAVLVGAGFGGSFILVPSVISNYYGKAAYARIYGLLLPIMNIVTCIAPTVAGAIYDASGSYSVAYVIFCCFGLIGVVGLALATPPRVK